MAMTGSLLVEIIRQGGEARGNDSSHIAAPGVDDVEGDRGAEINDDNRCAVVMTRGNGIRQAVLADTRGPGIINADATDGFGCELQRRPPQQGRDQRLRRRSRRGDHGTEHGTGNPVASNPSLQGRQERPRQEIGRVEIGGPPDRSGARQSHVQVGVANVEQEQHGSGSAETVTSPPMMRSRWPCSLRSR